LHVMPCQSHTLAEVNQFHDKSQSLTLVWRAKSISAAQSFGLSFGEHLFRTKVDT
jgi:hypothetical protein